MSTANEAGTPDRAILLSSEEGADELAAAHPAQLPPASRGSRKGPFLIAWCLCFLAVGAAGVIFVRNKAPLDFQAFYAAAHQIRTDPSRLYDLAQQMRIQQAIASVKGFLPFYHPSYEILVFLPFSMLIYPAAYSAFFCCNMLLLLWAFLRYESGALPQTRRSKRPELMLFLFLPLLLSLVLGQDSVISLVIYFLAWRQLAAGRDVRAGLVLALALFKFQLAIPIAVLIGVRRGWRFANGFLIGSAAVAVVSIAAVGMTGTEKYIRLLLGAVSAVDQNTIAQQKINVFPYAMPNLTGLLYACGGRFLHPAILFHLLSGLCALGLLAWSARLIRRSELNVAFSIAMVCGLLVNYHFYFYDLTLLIVPLALVGERVHRSIVIAVFCVPVVLFYVGMSWYFVMAVPMLGMLVAVGRLTPKARTLSGESALAVSG